MGFLVNSTFFLILLAVKDNKYFRNVYTLFHRPTQTRDRFHAVPSWHLIFLLHPTALHENNTWRCSFSLEDDITTLSRQSNKLPGICVYFEMKARNIDVPTWK